MDKISAALLIILLLPAVVAEWEARRLPDIFYVMLAFAGVIFAAVPGGVSGLIAAILVGLFSLALLAALVAGAQSQWGVRLMTGGHIKLLAAGATWLAPLGAVLMLLLVALLFLATVAVLRARNGRTIRPALSPMVAVAMLGVFMLMNHTNPWVFY